MTTPEKTLILAMLTAVNLLARGDGTLASDAVTMGLIEETKGNPEALQEIIPLVEELRDEQQALVNGTAVSVPATVGDPGHVGFDTVSAADWD